jgi:ABC-2 type transport system ATP-binding protein
VGFLGPNGAGKSTTLRVLTGFLAPTSGRALVHGHDVVLEPEQARRSLGYLPETCPLYPELRVQEYLRHRAELKRVARHRVRPAVESAMKLAGIHERRGALIGHLSRGLRQRVGIADALVSDPPLLILDEPTAGLDPNQIREVRELVGSLRGKHTVLLSTHILTEAEVTCDRAIVLSRGRVVASGTLHELGEQQRGATIRLIRANIEQSALEALLSPSCRLERCERSADELCCRVSLTDAGGLAPVLQRLVHAGLEVAEATLQHTNLEEVFARLTREDGDG